MNFTAGDTIFCGKTEMEAELFHIYFDAQYELRHTTALLTVLWIESVATETDNFGEKSDGKKEKERRLETMAKSKLYADEKDKINTLCQCTVRNWSAMQWRTTFTGRRTYLRAKSEKLTQIFGEARDPNQH